MSGRLRLAARGSRPGRPHGLPGRVPQPQHRHELHVGGAHLIQRRLIVGFGERGQQPVKVAREGLDGRCRPPSLLVLVGVHEGAPVQGDRVEAGRHVTGGRSVRAHRGIRREPGHRGGDQHALAQVRGLAVDSGDHLCVRHVVRCGRAGASAQKNRRSERTNAEGQSKTQGESSRTRHGRPLTDDVLSRYRGAGDEGTTITHRSHRNWTCTHSSIASSPQIQSSPDTSHRERAACRVARGYASGGEWWGASYPARPFRS